MGGGGPPTPVGGGGNFGPPGPYNAGREKDSIKLDKLPPLAGFETWRLSVGTAVKSASNTPHKAWRWILEVERADANIDDFAIFEESDFQTLDAKLHSAVELIAVGEIKDTIKQKTRVLKKQGHTISGRQCLFIAYRFYDTDKNTDPVYNLKALQAVKLFNDNLEGMLLEWDAALLDAEDVSRPSALPAGDLPCCHRGLA